MWEIFLVVRSKVGVPKFRVPCLIYECTGTLAQMCALKENLTNGGTRKLMSYSCGFSNDEINNIKTYKEFFALKNKSSSGQPGYHEYIYIPIKQTEINEILKDPDLIHLKSKIMNAISKMRKEKLIKLNQKI